MIEKNFVKEKIKSGKPVIGTWNTIASPMVTEILASAGFDFLVVDFEHGPFDIKDVHTYVNACERYSCSPIIRVPRMAEWMVLQALDQAAHGVIVPHMDTPKDMQNLIQATKYYPLGMRGFTPFTKAGGFTNLNAKDYAGKANDFTLSAVVVESQEGLDNLDHFLNVPELDVIYFGAYDLSQALGVPGQVKHEKVINAIKTAAAKVLKVGKCAGGFVAQTPDDIKWQLDLGLRFITYNVDTAILYTPAKQMTDVFNNIVKENL